MTTLIRRWLTPRKHAAEAEHKLREAQQRLAAAYIKINTARNDGYNEGFKDGRRYGEGRVQDNGGPAD